MTTFRSRLIKLENERRFLDWVIHQRLLGSLTAGELMAFAQDRKLPDSLSNRPCELDGVDRKSLIKLREEKERLLRGRSLEELKCYVLGHIWPRKWLEYSIKDGTLVFQWRIEPMEHVLDRDKQSGS